MEFRLSLHPLNAPFKSTACVGPLKPQKPGASFDGELVLRHMRSFSGTIFMTILTMTRSIAMRIR